MDQVNAEFVFKDCKQHGGKIIYLFAFLFFMLFYRIP